MSAVKSLIEKGVEFNPPLKEVRMLNAIPPLHSVIMIVCHAKSKFERLNLRKVFIKFSQSVIFLLMR